MEFRRRRQTDLSESGTAIVVTLKFTPVSMRTPSMEPIPVGTVELVIASSLDLLRQVRRAWRVDVRPRPML